MLVQALNAKYSVSALCDYLALNRSTYYFYLKDKKCANDSSELQMVIQTIFDNSMGCYGTRKIKCELKKLYGIVVSRRKISLIMKELKLVSSYIASRRKFKKHGSVDSEITNQIEGKYSDRKIGEVVLSDVTYIWIDNRWYYLCMLLDLCGRKIIGYSFGKKRDADLVVQALLSVADGLQGIGFFHTDHGSEFLNGKVEMLLQKNKIHRSLSGKGKPTENAPMESLNNIIKSEFVKPREFTDALNFELEFAKYVDWYNNDRIHSSLDYRTPLEWRENVEKYSA